jgi:hypothetical protein
MCPTVWALTIGRRSKQLLCVHLYFVKETNYTEKCEFVFSYKFSFIKPFMGTYCILTFKFEITYTVKGKIVPVLYYQAMKTHGNYRSSYTIFGLGTRGRWVVSFTSRPRYPWYQLDRRLGGPQSRSGLRISTGRNFINQNFSIRINENGQDLLQNYQYLCC